MVNALVDMGGVERLARFIRATERTDQVKALRDVYGLTPVQFEDRILEWIAQGPR